MVRIVSTHAILGDQRTPEMYGWGTLNPDMGEPIKVGFTEAKKIKSRLKRKRKKDALNQSKLSGG